MKTLYILSIGYVCEPDNADQLAECITEAARLAGEKSGATNVVGYSAIEDNITSESTIDK